MQNVAHLRLSCAVLLLCCIAPLAGCRTLSSSRPTEKADFHVRPTDRLFRFLRSFPSIEAARDAVRPKIAAGMDRDLVVLLRGGTYFLSEPARFDERDGGRDGFNVVYRAARGENVTIYGGLPVTGSEKWRGGIYRAKVPKGKPFYRLFENGCSAVMARTPNKGSGYGGGGRTAGNTTVRIPDEWKDYDFADAQLFGWRGPNWFSEMRKVTAVDREKDTLTVTPGCGGTPGLGKRIYLRGVLQLLDERGEWCLESEEGYVYYWPRAFPINEQLIVAPTMQRVLDAMSNLRGEVRQGEEQCRNQT